MSRLVWMLLGLMGGVAISRNAPALTAPQGAAVILACIVGCGICWWAGFRGKSVAVATAVATAVAVAEAKAEATAEAQALAIASAQFHLHLSETGAQDPTTGAPRDGWEHPRQLPPVRTPLSAVPWPRGSAEALLRGLPGHSQVSPDVSPAQPVLVAGSGDGQAERVVEHRFEGSEPG